MRGEEHADDLTTPDGAAGLLCCFIISEVHVRQRRYHYPSALMRQCHCCKGQAIIVCETFHERQLKWGDKTKHTRTHTGSGNAAMTVFRQSTQHLSNAQTFRFSSAGNATFLGSPIQLHLMNVTLT